MNFFKSLVKNFKLKHYVLYFILIAFIIVSSVFSITGIISKDSTLKLLEIIGYNIIAALSLSLVVGFLGELSLGHAAYMSIGAMVGAKIQQTLLVDVFKASPLLSLILAMIIGGLVAAIFGLVIGLPALRLKGDYLAIVTLAFGEIVKVVFQNIDYFGGAIGIKNRAFRYDTQSLFIIIFIVLLLVLALILNLIKSKHGRAIMAIRDNEIAAKAMGINVTFYKLFVFVLSAFIAGVAGVLYASSSNQIVATKFDYNYSINNILVIVVLGGMGNINGTIVAAIIVSLLNTKLQTIFTGDLSSLKDIIYALILVLVVMYNNAPKLKYFRERYSFKKLFEKIKKRVFKPSKEKQEAEQKQFGADWSVIPTKINMDAIVSTDLDVTTSEVDKGELENE